MKEAWTRCTATRSPCRGKAAKRLSVAFYNQGHWQNVWSSAFCGHVSWNLRNSVSPESPEKFAAHQIVVEKPMVQITAAWYQTRIFLPQPHLLNGVLV